MKNAFSLDPLPLLFTLGLQNSQNGLDHGGAHSPPLGSGQQVDVEVGGVLQIEWGREVKLWSLHLMNHLLERGEERRDVNSDIVEMYSGTSE